VPGNLITLIAAIAIVALVATLLMRAVKTSAATALKIAAIVLVLQLGFSIGPEAIWLQLRELLQLAREGVSGLGGWQ